MSAFFHMLALFFRDMFLYMMVAIFLENTIFSRAIGTSTSLYAVRKKFNVFLFGLIMTVVITVSSIITYFVAPLIKTISFASYVTPVVYVGIIGIVYIGALLFTGRFIKKRKKDILSIIHVSAFNCATLGALLLASDISDPSFGAFLGFGIGSGLGFTLATYFVSLAYERLSSEKVPNMFRGFPITLIYIGLVSLAIYGLIGHQLTQG